MKFLKIWDFRMSHMAVTPMSETDPLPEIGLLRGVVTRPRLRRIGGHRAGHISPSGRFCWASGAPATWPRGWGLPWWEAEAPVEAKRLRLLPRVRPVIDELRGIGYGLSELSDELVAEILRRC